MEPSQKRAKITGHFRVALKPQDVNVPSLKKFKKAHDLGKENKIEVITIEDDDDDDEDNKRTLINLKTARQQLLEATTTTNNNITATNNNFSLISNNNHNCYKNRNNTNSNHNNNYSIHRYLKRESLRDQQLEEEEEDDILNVVEEDDSTTQDDEEEEENVVNNILNNQQQLQQHCHNRQLSPINRYQRPPGIKSINNNCDNLDSIVDFDESVQYDIHFEPHYAWDSFYYDRQRELLFENKNYLETQDISTTMRARLVDWLVFIQNNFSLDHEALYMAVKMSDQYLMKKQCPKYLLPLLYLTSVLISSKFEERLPPVSIAELMEHSNRKYSRKQVLSFEADLLQVLNFNIRFPLSYTFLRRFAICTKSDKTILTLARYILESSLLEYDMIDIIESKLAAASLLLAFRMLNSHNRWDNTAIYYTGYKEEELFTTLRLLNINICSEKVSKSTTRKKYNHQLFLNVARIPPLSNKYLDELAGHDAKKNTTIITTHH